MKVYIMKYVSVIAGLAIILAIVAGSIWYFFIKETKKQEEFSGAKLVFSKQIE